MATSSTLPATTPTDAPTGSGVLSKLKTYLPDTFKLYLEPLDPNVDMPPADRLSLIWRSACPWNDFFDLSNFNLPPFDQITNRLGHNIQTYFYNYFILSVVHLLLFSIGHFGSVLTLVVWCAFMYWLFVANEGDIDVMDMFVITRNVKLLIAAGTALLALFMGGVLTLIFSLMVFLLLVVGVHGSIREVPSDMTETIPIDNI